MLHGSRHQYLGVYFDETLKWNERIDFVCNTSIKYFGIFIHIKNKVTSQLWDCYTMLSYINKMKYRIESYSIRSEKKTFSGNQVIQNNLNKLILSWDW